MAQYLHRFTLQSSLQSPYKKNRNHNGTGNQADGLTVNGAATPTQFVEGRDNLHSKSKMNGGLSQAADGQREEAALDLKRGSGSSVFGVGASREFICISCGDDFDSEENLAFHQNECDESARMVGSGSGDGLLSGSGSGGSRKRLSSGSGGSSAEGSGGKRGKSGGEEEEVEEKDENASSKNDNHNQYSRRNSSEKENSDSTGKLDERTASLSNNGGDESSKRGGDLEDIKEEESATAIAGDGVAAVALNNDSLTTGSNDDDGKERAKEEEEGGRRRDVSVEREKEREKGVNQEEREKEKEGEESVVNDNNNNAVIHRRLNSFGSESKKSDLRFKHGRAVTSKPAIVTDHSPLTKTSHNHVSQHSSSSSSPPTTVSNKFVWAKDAFNTRGLSSSDGYHDNGDGEENGNGNKNRYTSSTSGLSSHTARLARPRNDNTNKCRLCGKAFWDRKMVDQHWVLDHGVRRGQDSNDDNNNKHGDEPQPSQKYLGRPGVMSPSPKSSPSKENPTTTPMDMMTLSSGLMPPLSTNHRGGFAGTKLSSASLAHHQYSHHDQMESSRSNKGVSEGGQADTPRKHENKNKDVYSNATSVIRSRSSVNINGGGEGGVGLADSSSLIHWAKDYLKNFSDGSSITNPTPSDGSTPTTPKTTTGNGLRDGYHDLNFKSSSSPPPPQQPPSSSSSLSPPSSSSSKADTGSGRGMLGLPGGGGQSLAPSALLNDYYLAQYSKLAQWCMSQGPNFCPICLVNHTNGNPCPRFASSISSSGALDAATSTLLKVKVEKPDDDDDENKKVNVDGDEDEDEPGRTKRMDEEGPLDMSKSSLEFSPPMGGQSSSSSLSSSTPHHSSSSRFMAYNGIPPYYNYGHFLAPDSAAAIKAIKNGGGASTTPHPDLMPGHKLGLLDLSTDASGISKFVGAANSAFNAYHHAFLSPTTTTTDISTNDTIGPHLSAATPQSRFSPVIIGSAPNTSSSSSSSSSATAVAGGLAFPLSSPTIPPSQAFPPTSRKSKKTPGSKPGFPCTVCLRVYTHQSALITHMRSHSPSVRSYRCQFCQETFARAPDLKVHVCPNGVEKPFTCPSCGQTFAKNIHLKRHLATHSGLKPYPCWICGKRFSRSDHLKRHTQSIHAGAKPHACLQCGKEFVRKYELNKHMACHSG